MADFFDDLQKAPGLEDLETDFERAEYLQQILVNHATQDGPSDNSHYQTLRKHFLDREDTKKLVPEWARIRRDLSQYWQFIKYKFAHYQERREFVWKEFQPLLDYLENTSKAPLDASIMADMVSLSSDYVIGVWQKALARKGSDPDGAITAARTLLEAVLKHILDQEQVPYDSAADLHEIYRKVAELLHLTSEQHEEVLFKKVLGGCSAVVSGIGELRNQMGDAHGHGKRRFRASPRHAELAVNMAGTMCLFIVQTYAWRQSQKG